MTAEPYSDQVLDDIQAILSVEFGRAGFIPKPGFKLSVGLCSDGVLVACPAVDLQGRVLNMITLAITEATIMGLNCQLRVYFQRNRRFATQTLLEYQSHFARGMNEPTGVN
jgi:hypothetical protein